MSVTVGDVVAVLSRLFPPQSAQSWDQVGLVTGDLDQPVRRVHAAVDPTLAVIQEARDAGADLLLTHHPLLLRGVHSVATTTAKGESVTSLVVGDVALYVAHTNADSADPGVNTALAAAAGIEAPEPLAIEEERPLGLVGRLAAPLSLRALAERLHGSLPAAPGGIRVSGPADAAIETVAVMGGAGDGMLDAVRRSGADAYVTADLRHHPALEAREESRGGPPYLLDVGHWAGESLWLSRALTDLLSGLAADGHDPATVDTYVSTLCTDPWTFTVGATGPEGAQD
ncbi:Nif3-like dinuclear metal center hexameric protein [Marihabitans asiaticum]|uniref:GTP cyclohydrolase 1 type 2 homolog n=1 Tax=Marihabitans asiaticum TaxID=415218 RepID=A0A560WAG4_9MICO|nr:Nif3-like dinuclear metal center hexameric protein [Marihabitans asiaticum]TWD14616.1 dinuclear metal center YbgI/SA1388 family protein [Marihabitans asiaticum]